MTFDLGYTIAGSIGGATVAMVTAPADKITEVVAMAIIGGVVGAFAKGAGSSLWDVVRGIYKAHRAKRRKP